VHNTGPEAAADSREQRITIVSCINSHVHPYTGTRKLITMI